MLLSARLIGIATIEETRRERTANVCILVISEGGLGDRRADTVEVGESRKVQGRDQAAQKDRKRRRKCCRASDSARQRTECAYSQCNERRPRGASKRQLKSKTAQTPKLYEAADEAYLGLGSSLSWLPCPAFQKSRLDTQDARVARQR